MQGGGLLAEQRQRRLVLRQIRPNGLDRDCIPGLDGATLVDLAHTADRDEVLDLVDPVQLRPRSPTRRLLRPSPTIKPALPCALIDLRVRRGIIMNHHHGHVVGAASLKGQRDEAVARGLRARPRTSARISSSRT